MDKDNIIIIPGEQDNEKYGVIQSSEAENTEEEQVTVDGKLLTDGNGVSIYEQPEPEQDETEQDGIEENKQNIPVPEIDPVALSLNTSITTIDIMSKLNVFIQIYGSKMRAFKKEHPTEWDEILKQLKEKYSTVPYDLDTTIELIAALSIEYEDSLKNKKTNSILQQKLDTMK